MALLFRPRPFLVSIPTKTPKSPFRFCTSAVRVESTTGTTAILWYKHDLRIEDHPGLIAASRHRSLVPLYVFDRRILSRFSDEMLELLLFALEDLRKLLKEKGSNLMIRFGTAENVISKLVQEVQASSLFVEEEAEYELCTMLDTVKKSLSSLSFKEENPEIVMWSSPFYDVKNLNDLPSSFDDFQKLKLPVVAGLEPPELPANIMDLSWGPLPTLADLKEFMDDVSDGGNMKKEWTSILKSSALNMLQKKKQRRNLEQKSAESKNSNEKDSVSNTTERMKSEKSAFVTSQGNLVGGGASLVLIALAAYLRYLEGTSRYEFQEVHAKLRLTEEREGASFQALFGSALLLGIISRRRVYFEAIKYEKERNGGFLSPFGYSTTTVAASINGVSSIEWYWLLALKNQRNKAGNISFRIWRWKNYLIQYTVAGHMGPAILLVHGFGAFLEHYRDNLHPVAAEGNRVWAITLLGFGKSEKPNIIYTELLWAELLRDFIIEVVREPVHLIGNSIGGYAAAIVAGFWPSLAKSVVLMNSAGNIVPGYSPLGYSEDRRISGAAWLGARLLLVYLRLNIRNILRGFYPTGTDRVDDWLMNEMIRASYDPGVIFVLESIFSFDLSLPLNYLLEEFKKKILVIQGTKDPLVDSRSKLAMFREHCRGIAIKEIDAGHCPHDELPNEVNSIITEWVATLESEASPSQPPPSQSFTQDPAVAAVGPSIPTFRMPHAAFPPNAQNLPYPQWNHFPSPQYAPHNYIQQNPSANPNLNPDFSSPPGIFNYTAPQFDLHFARLSLGDDARNLGSSGVNLNPSVAHQQGPNLIFGSLNRDIGAADALNRNGDRGNSHLEEGLGMDRRRNRFPLNTVEFNENAQGNSSVSRGYKQERNRNSNDRRDNGNFKVLAPPPGFSNSGTRGVHRLSNQLDSPGLPVGSNLPSSSASDIEESMIELHGVDGDELRSARNAPTELDGLEDQLKDESGERSDKKKHHRDKDYRSDNRGQWIMSQRMRHLKRQTTCRNDIHILNGPLLAVFESLIPSNEEKVKQRQLLMLLEKLVGKEWPEARLYLYGSCANSFGFSKSDIDVCLEMDLGNIDKPTILLKLAEVFESDNLQNVQALTRARVPVVKLMDPATGISCDICINNVLAVINTKLLHDYSKIDARLRQLAFIVKHWAKSRGVNETYHGTLSSYAYVLMCIHFLQQRRPPILPCLQEMPKTYYATVEQVECAYFDDVEKLKNFGSRNGESIAQLVWGFFHYWAYCHDYADNVISVRTGRTLSKRDKDWTRRVGNDRHLICIEDPFETSHDLGRVVDKFSIRVLREEFERAAQIMQYDPNPCASLFAPYIPN